MTSQNEVDAISGGAQQPPRRWVRIVVSGLLIVAAATGGALYLTSRHHTPSGESATAANARAVTAMTKALADHDAVHDELGDALTKLRGMVGPSDAATYRTGVDDAVGQARSWLMMTGSDLTASAAEGHDQAITRLAKAMSTAFALEADDLRIAAGGTHGVDAVNVDLSGNIRALLTDARTAIGPLQQEYGVYPGIAAHPNVTVAVPGDITATLRRLFDTSGGVRLLVGGMWVDPVTGATTPTGATDVESAVAVGTSVALSARGIVWFVPSGNRARRAPESAQFLAGPGPDASSVWAFHIDAPGQTVTLYGLDGAVRKGPVPLEFDGYRLTPTTASVGNRLVAAKVSARGKLCTTSQDGGIDLRRESLVLWNPATGELRQLTEPTCNLIDVLGVAAGKVAWQTASIRQTADQTGSLRITDSAAHTTNLPAPTGMFPASAAANALSPDGRWLAVLCGNGRASAPDLCLVDTTSGATTRITLTAATTPADSAAVGAQVAWVPTTASGDSVLYADTISDDGTVRLVRVTLAPGAAPAVEWAHHPIADMPIPNNATAPTILALDD